MTKKKTEKDEQPTEETYVSPSDANKDSSAAAPVDSAYKAVSTPQDDDEDK